MEILRLVIRPLRFPLGRVYSSRGVADLAANEGYDPLLHLTRHIEGDWGALCEEDLERNDLALSEGGRLFSSYNLDPGFSAKKVWIITEADRSATTILLPSEY